MNVHDKLLEQIAKALDSRSFEPKEMAARFSDMDITTQTLWLGVIVETLYYIQHKRHEMYPGYSGDVVQLVDTLFGHKDFGSLYGAHNWYR